MNTPTEKRANVMKTIQKKIQVNNKHYMMFRLLINTIEIRLRYIFYLSYWKRFEGFVLIGERVVSSLPWTCRWVQPTVW